MHSLQPSAGSQPQPPTSTPAPAPAVALEQRAAAAPEVIHLSPGGREGPIPTSSTIISQAMERLSELNPQLTGTQREAVHRAVTWAVAFETDINNTIIRNSNRHEMSGSIVDRRRPEFLQAGAETLLSELSAEFLGNDRHASIRPGYVRSPEELARLAVERVRGLELGFSPEQLREVHSTVTWAIAAETEANNLLLQDEVGKEIRDCLVKRVRPSVVATNADGSPRKEKLDTTFWSEWHPGLDNDHLTLREVYNTLPGFPASKVPEVVRRYENPDSPEALPGAVTLLRHDLIHILVGRGLLDQDEAFVIGYTMGTAKDDLSEQQAGLMKAVFQARYPEPYRIAEEDLMAFDLGVRTGREMGMRDLYKYPIEDFMDMTIGHMRRTLGISVEKLRAVYREEAEKIPNTLETARLPV